MEPCYRCNSKITIEEIEVNGYKATKFNCKCNDKRYGLIPKNVSPYVDASKYSMQQKGMGVQISTKDEHDFDAYIAVKNGKYSSTPEKFILRVNVMHSVDSYRTTLKSITYKDLDKAVSNAIKYLEMNVEIVQDRNNAKESNKASCTAKHEQLKEYYGLNIESYSYGPTCDPRHTAEMKEGFYATAEFKFENKTSNISIKYASSDLTKKIIDLLREHGYKDCGEEKIR